MISRIKESMTSPDIDGRQALAAVGTAGAVAGAAFLAYRFVPEAYDTIKDTYSANKAVIAGTLASVAIGSAALGNKDHDVDKFGIQRTIRGKVLLVLAGVTAAASAVVAADRFFIGEEDGSNQTSANGGPVFSLPEGDTSQTSEMFMNPDSQCEILPDFNSPESRQSPRYELDAWRLESVLYDLGYFDPGAARSDVVDGDLDDAGVAVDRLQEANGLDVSERWNMDACNVIAELVNRNPADPAFSAQPELRFQG
jgi:hypothetical protein